MFKFVHFIFWHWLIICVATEISLNITGSPELELWKEYSPSIKVYRYNFTDGETFTLSCDYYIKYINTSIPREDYLISIKINEEKEVMAVITNSTGHRKYSLPLNKENKNITCEAIRFKDSSPDENSYRKNVIQLHYVPSKRVCESGTSDAIAAIAVVSIIIIALLVALILKYLRRADELQETSKIYELTLSRPAMKPPKEIIYDHVYSHGAGLWRPPLKAEPNTECGSSQEN